MRTFPVHLHSKQKLGMTEGGHSSQKLVGSISSRQKWSGWYTAALASSLVALGVTARAVSFSGKTLPDAVPAYEFQEARAGLRPRSGAGKGSPSRKATAAGWKNQSSQSRRQGQGLGVAMEASASPAEGTGANDSAWNRVGGEFGLSADWREAIRESKREYSAIEDGGSDSGWEGLRGEACTTSAKREEVWDVLEKRKPTPSRKKVAACLRTKDYARFLPEWLAFHYAIGVDEVSVYDDDSADNTTAVLQPFVEAGFVRYVFEVIARRSHEMEPLNNCLRYYQEQKQIGAINAPTYLLFHDTDEYIFPVDTSLTILEALEKYHDTCCVQVPRIQYGSAGFSEMPRGLMIEKFLSHQSSSTRLSNPKVMVNLEPTESDPALHLKSMHNAEGCRCHSIGRGFIRINHYLGSHGDYVDRLSRYWPDVIQSSHDMDAAHRFAQRDQNDDWSDTITHWACATREILFRVAQGLDLETGLEREREGGGVH